MAVGTFHTQQSRAISALAQKKILANLHQHEVRPFSSSRHTIEETCELLIMDKHLSTTDRKAWRWRLMRLVQISVAGSACKYKHPIYLHWCGGTALCHPVGRKKMQRLHICFVASYFIFKNLRSKGRHLSGQGLVGTCAQTCQITLQPNLAEQLVLHLDKKSHWSVTPEGEGCRAAEIMNKLPSKGVRRPLLCTRAVSARYVRHTWGNVSLLSLQL